MRTRTTRGHAGQYRPSCFLALTHLLGAMIAGLVIPLAAPRAAATVEADFSVQGLNGEVSNLVLMSGRTWILVNSDKKDGHDKSLGNQVYFCAADGGGTPQLLKEMSGPRYITPDPADHILWIVSPQCEVDYIDTAAVNPSVMHYSDAIGDTRWSLKPVSRGFCILTADERALYCAMSLQRPLSLKLKLKSAMGPAVDWCATNDTLWLAFEHELLWFRIAAQGTQPIEPQGRKAAEIKNLFLADQTLWIATEYELLHRRADGSDEPKPLEREPDPVVPTPVAGASTGKSVKTLEISQPLGLRSFSQAGDELWFRTSDELFRCKADGSSRAKRVGPIENLTCYPNPPRGLWATQGTRVYRCDPGADGGLRLMWEMPDAVNKVQFGGGPIDYVWIDTDHGQFYAPADGSRKPRAAPEFPGARLGYSFGHAPYSAAGDTIWIRHDSSCFRLRGFASPWQPRAKLTGTMPGGIYSDSVVPLEWAIENYDDRTSPSLVRQRVVLNDSAGRPVPLPEDGHVAAGRFYYVLPQLKAGNYTATVEVTDLWGNTARVAQPIAEMRVLATPAMVIVGWAKTATALYSGATGLAFVGLVLGSRRSRRCFDVLTDPIMRGVGVYFGLAIRHVTPVRLWVFERYFQNVKRDLRADHTYVPGPLIRPDGKRLQTTELLQELAGQTHVWVRGSPGSGKSEMVGNAMLAYFAERSLRSAWKRYHFVPILVRVRELRAERSVPELARAALGAMQTVFDKDAFFNSLLANGGFLIVLDGLNEAQLDEAVAEFSAAVPSVRLLVTSQTVVTGRLKQYDLPRVEGEFAKQLLPAFLGEPRGGEAVAAVDPALWPEVRSGFDVRLIADLFTVGRPVPAGRLQLYQAALDHADALFGGSYAAETICRVAWDLWKRGERRFGPDGRLTTDLLAPLERASVVIRRGEHFEFCHDLMRGYLAACWAARHAATIAATLACLEQPEVWSLSREEQLQVFPFLTQLIDSSDALNEIAQFAAAKPDQRVILLSAVQIAARAKGWSAKVTIG